MAVCTFFGHRYCSNDILPRLTEVLTNLIENHSVDTFYVGHNGDFDRIVYGALVGLKEQYPHIEYSVVLAYLPGKQTASEQEFYNYTIFPEGIEKGPIRFAIIRRNKWMLSKADFVVTHVHDSGGGSGQFRDMALRQGKTVINIL